MEYIIFDLEANCYEENDPKRPPNFFGEIVEIGAVKLDEQLNEIGRLDLFVKPVLFPQISPFCTHLTTITQEHVMKAPTIDIALRQFAQFAGPDPIFCSWGFYDKAQIEREVKEKKLDDRFAKFLAKRHISVKHKYAEIRGVRPCGMERALILEKLPLDGTHHRGIDDAVNIAKLFRLIQPQIVSSKLK